MSINWKKIGLFAGGTLFGTAGIKILSGKDAKKVYTGCTAAVLLQQPFRRMQATSMQKLRTSTRQELQKKKNLKIQQVRNK